MFGQKKKPYQNNELVQFQKNRERVGYVQSASLYGEGSQRDLNNTLISGIEPNSSTEVNDQFSPLSSVTAEDNLQPLSEQQKEYFVNSNTKECFS